MVCLPRLQTEVHSTTRFLRSKQTVQSVVKSEAMVFSNYLADSMTEKPSSKDIFAVIRILLQNISPSGIPPSCASRLFKISFFSKDSVASAIVSTLKEKSDQYFSSSIAFLS